MERSILLQELSQFCSKYDSQTYLGSYRDTARASLLKEGLSTRANSLWKMAEYVVAYKDDNNNDPDMLPAYIQGWKRLASNFANQYLLLEISDDSWRMYDSQGNELGDEKYILDHIKTKVNATQKTTKKYDGPKQVIYFGAPGTGKSFKLEKDRKDQGFNDQNVERVTFYATYSYSQFVGTYKPNVTDSNELTYSFVPGPFIRQYVNAIQHPNEKFLLIVEEINRANAAAVFGDMFQLLDRKGGESVYGIAVSEDSKKFFRKTNNEFQKKYPDANYDPISELSIKLPKNLFIWATMNSADQGVFPLDTAFKRRWETEYLGINSNSEEIEHIQFSLKPSPDAPRYSWNVLREKINDRLAREFKVNEDKLIGPFYIDKDLYCEEKPFAFSKIIASKIIMYLFEDAAKPYRHKFFHVSEALPLTYSNVCQEFYLHGPSVFGVDFEPENDENTIQQNNEMS